jgi:dihydrofolate reductase
MRKLIALEQISLDGVIQGPGGAEEDPRNGFNLGGWAMVFMDDTVSRFFDKLMSGQFDLLLGHWTYKLWAAFWPHQNDNIAKAFNQATKYVATHGQDKLGWERSIRLSGDAAEAVRKLKASDGPDLHMLFNKGLPPGRLELVESIATSTGAVLNTYRFVGRVKPEDFAQ